MELSLIFTVFLVVIAHAVHGRYDKDRSWMLFPGENGQQGMVLSDLEVPISKSKIDPYKQVKFYLYTRSNRVKTTQIYVGNPNLGEFDSKRNSKFIIHGHKSSYDKYWFQKIKDAFLDDENCNVIAVDWSGPASYNYVYASFATKAVGAYVGEMYKFLKSGSKTHCVGHSLGAHVCGYSGKKVGGQLQRITGLDPAYIWIPLFAILKKTDAQYVDVIHTCGNLFVIASSIGHADFYPNGGFVPQPGCERKPPIERWTCSHIYAVKVFWESITWKFEARECRSWKAYKNGNCNKNKIGIMGNKSNPKTRGVFYLATNTSPDAYTQI